MLDRDGWRAVARARAAEDDGWSGFEAAHALGPRITAGPG
ncbi:hypothetical protein APASM_1221 [Actinosynnema pretiosum subsp. pretiosum]|nr:hypothetical protein APASM_1221 [Actinosynnema pretiosum subsp. pretiosum]